MNFKIKLLIVLLGCLGYSQTPIKPTVRLLAKHVTIKNWDGLSCYTKKTKKLSGKYDLFLKQLVKSDTPMLLHSKYLVASGRFNKGLKTGHWQTLYKHTIVKSEHWDNGLITGKYTVYNTDKKILYSTDFGKQGNGHYKTYNYRTETLQEEGAYKNGKKEGEWCFYNSNGTLKDSIIYVKGVAKTKT